MAAQFKHAAWLRVAPLLLAVALSTAALGCGSNSVTSPTTTPTPVPAATPTPAPAPAPAPSPATAPTTVSLTGTVSNSSGDRVGGATVTILDGTDAGKTAGTNSSGEYRFDSLTAGNANLGATATFYTEDRRGVYVDGTNSLNFTLTRATVSLSGTVSSSSGGRISGATVKVLDGPNKDQTTDTNSNGEYRFSSLSAADVNFSASATGYRSDFRGVAVNGGNSLNFTLTPIPVAASVSISTNLIVGGGGSIPQEWEFVATLAGNPTPTVTHYNWDFGDGSSANETNATERHLYGSKGTFTVKVVAVRSSGGNLEAEYSLTID